MVFGDVQKVMHTPTDTIAVQEEDQELTVPSRSGCKVLELSNNCVILCESACFCGLCIAVKWSSLLPVLVFKDHVNPHSFSTSIKACKKQRLSA